MRTIQARPLATVAFALLASLAGSAFAQTTIDQNKALAGNINPGDAPGFPITLSLTGSYKLTSNLVVPAGTRGIEINADGITLDLNGFTIMGPVTCNAALNTPCTTAANNQHGITSQGNGTALRNGTVRGFSGSGVVLIHPGAAALQDMVLADNASHGLSIASIGGAYSNAGTRVTRVTAVQNGGAGFSNNGSATADVLFDNSTASSNHGDGFSLQGGSGTIHACSGEDNKGYGLASNGFSLLSGSRFQNNTLGNVTGQVNSAGGNLNQITLF